MAHVVPHQCVEIDVQAHLEEEEDKAQLCQHFGAMDVGDEAAPDAIWAQRHAHHEEAEDARDTKALAGGRHEGDCRDQDEGIEVNIPDVVDKAQEEGGHHAVPTLA